MAQYAVTVGFTEQASKPSAPSSGNQRLYMKTDGKLYLENSTGTETVVGGGGQSASFTSILVSGQNTILATTASDTLEFVASTGIVITTNTSVKTVTIMQNPYVIYGVRIDNTSADPESGVIYTDDAIGMTEGSTSWNSCFPFNVIRPCVLSNPAGTVNYYLNPKNYAQKADGTSANITTGADGDVMVEIPKMAYSIVTTGDYMYVKVTNNPAPVNGTNEDWHFYAHTRSTEGDKTKLYVGAYHGSGTANLTSLSGAAPLVSHTIGAFRTHAQANGTGYDILAFYPLTLLQCLFLIRYKSRDSQTALGRGYVDTNASAINTGGADAKGMYYGEATGKYQMKFAGIEDFWGNVYNWIDGFFSNATRNILTAFTSFNNTGSGYTDNGIGAGSDIGEYLATVQGTSATGFITKTVETTSTNYYADYANLCASSLPNFGGRWDDGSVAGAFQLLVGDSAAYSYSNIGARLMFL
jgi:hypothetical protein